MKCAVNPTCGREFQTKFWESPRRKNRVLIAGGGPAGMQAAITAADRGHEVILCEKGNLLGGALKTAEHVSFKFDLSNYKQSLINRVNNRAIRVMMNTQVDEELCKLLKPDVLICAIGGEKLCPSIPGIELDHVVFAEDIWKKEKPIGQQIAIIGGGMTGAEEALNFAMEGKDVTILEMCSSIAKDGNFRGREALLQEIDKYSNIHIHIGTKALEILNDGIKAQCEDGNTLHIPAETVIIAAGRLALNDEAEKMREWAPEFVLAGDCKKSGKILDAVRGGYYAAMNVY